MQQPKPPHRDSAWQSGPQLFGKAFASLIASLMPTAQRLGFREISLKMQCLTGIRQDINIKNGCFLFKTVDFYPVDMACIDGNATD